MGKGNGDYDMQESFLLCSQVLVNGNSLVLVSLDEANTCYLAEVSCGDGTVLDTVRFITTNGTINHMNPME